MRVLHIITGLGNGGAESNLYKICKNDKSNNHTVISLLDQGIYGVKLKKLGVPVYSININKNFFFIFSFIKILKKILIIKPDIVQTWMYHADFLGGLASKLVGIKKIFWNIRASNFSKDKTKKTTIFLVKILSYFSWWIPNKIIVCSEIAKEFHVSIGYCAEKMQLIRNGYDFSNFKINKNKIISPDIRKKFKIKPQVPLIGTIARFDPQKDHANLLKALSVLRKRQINFFCILAGPGIDKNNKFLINLINELKLNKFVKLLGNSNNIINIMRQLDIHILPSQYGEGFPNVVAESMACMTPNISTDVGDAKFLIDDTGWVVPPNRFDLLAKAINMAIKEIPTIKWELRCRKSRNRIKKNFSIFRMKNSYREVWKQAI